MNIVFAGNYKVFKGMLLGTLSIIKYYKEPLNLYILTMELKEQDPDYIAVSDEDIKLLEKVVKDVNKKSTVTKIDVTGLYIEHLLESPNSKTRYTAYTLLRLLLDEVAGIPLKVLYLDTDVLANDDISLLYNTDISNYELAGVKDRYGRFFMGPRYLNAGVLLLNMQKIKETGLFTKCRAYLNKKEVFLSDQTAINKYVKKKLILKRRFNEQKQVKKDTVIRHFSMQFRLFPKFHFVNIKPWHKDRLHKEYKCHHFDDILEKYEAITKEKL
ncbi:MAG: glycosyltransferase [Bacilli bacterium]|jgi:lipopolysaccharide biosynthesis glycosyltransferase|nr:glycosyltransferase [Bacilli bacterium]HOM32251.1 glycosyltransferase [Bacilli bacterium]HQB97200.1 glycosyltransferase [Bacilli bacterium]